MMNDPYASAGPLTAPTAAKSAQGRETTMRASRYDGKIAADMTTTLKYLTAAYAVWMSWMRQNGAMKYVYSVSNRTWWCRTAASPVSAMLRAISEYLSSSVKSHG